jgi:hypothetical protein
MSRVRDDQGSDTRTARTLSTSCAIFGAMIPQEHLVWRKILVCLIGSLVLSTAARDAVADTSAPTLEPPALLPPPPNNRFIQFGVAFTTEFVAGSNALCSGNPTVVPHCILGSGAGLVFPRVGWRSPGHWYLGGAYEFSKQDASTLYLLPILQQLRAEARYYFLEGHVGTPFVEGSLGVAAYGNEWTVDAYGPAASLSFGVEAQISQTTVVGVSLAYRIIHFNGFVDSASNTRDPGFTQLLGLNVLLEARDPY